MNQAATMNLEGITYTSKKLSWMTEVRNLQVSFKRMVISLRKYRTFLPSHLSFVRTSGPWVNGFHDNAKQNVDDELINSKAAAVIEIQEPDISTDQPEVESVYTRDYINDANHTKVMGMIQTRNKVNSASDTSRTISEQSSFVRHQSFGIFDVGIVHKDLSLIYLRMTNFDTIQTHLSPSE
jgi:hypothetical protein